MPFIVIFNNIKKYICIILLGVRDKGLAEIKPLNLICLITA